MNREIQAYCENDVQCLPGLYEVYQARLRYKGLEEMVRDETEHRLRESTSVGYDPHGPDAALAPDWDELAYDDYWDIPTPDSDSARESLWE